MLQSILGRFMGGRRGATPTARTTRPAGGSATDAAVGRGVRGLLGRFTRR